MLILVFLLFVQIFGESFKTRDNREITHRVGYVGPACAVVDDALFLHGSYVRKLNEDEKNDFKAYQKNLTLFNDYYEKYGSSDSYTSVTKSAVYSAPTIIQIPVLPSFCEGLDDSVEVVLNGCTDNRVFISGRLIRPLNNLERKKIAVVVRDQSTTVSRHKRETNDFSDIQNNMTSILHSLLNLNSTVAQRFLPVAKMSPILSDVNTSLLSENHLSEAFNQVFQRERPNLPEELKRKIEVQMNKNLNMPTPTVSTPETTTANVSEETLVTSASEPPTTFAAKWIPITPKKNLLQTSSLSNPAPKEHITLPYLQIGNKNLQTSLPNWQSYFPWSSSSSINDRTQHMVNSKSSQTFISDIQSTPAYSNFAKSLGYGDNLQSQQIGSTALQQQFKTSWPTNQIFGNNLINPSNVQSTTSSSSAQKVNFIPAKILPHEICRAHIVDAFHLWSDGQIN